MSKLQQKPIYGDRAIQIQWMNLIFNSHGMICGCDNPRKHLQDLLDLDDKKCLLTTPVTDGDEGHSGDAAFDGITEGDLEELFKDSTDADTG